MSSIIDYTEPLSASPNILGGLDIVGFEGAENKLQGTQNSDFIRGGQFGDIIDGGAGFDFIDGQGGDDRLNGGDGLDFILGGSGNDVISGGTDNDIIDGGSGNDVINGDAGSDRISGGAGQDTFIIEFFNTGVDSITDFQVGEDKIVIQGVGSDANVDYDKQTGKLSVDGQEIAQLNAGLDWNDNSYDIF